MNEQHIRYLNREKETMAWPARQKKLSEKLAAIYNLVMANSDAYKELYRTRGLAKGDIDSIYDLSRLPTIRLSDIVDRQSEYPPWGGFCVVPESEIRRVYVNPGFIFQPVGFEYSDTTWAEGLVGGGIVSDDRVINTFNYHLWPYAMMLDESLRMIGARAVPTGVGNSFMQVRILQRLAVTGFLGTPSFLMTLSQRADVMNIDPIRDLTLKHAVTGAERLSESLREKLERIFDITIRQTYGTVLLGCIGYECEYLTGLHVPDNIIVEIIDPQTGEPVKQGQSGEIVATSFSPVYPMIRLATGDISRFIKNRCPCGRTGPMLERITGRIDQATKVHGTFIHHWQTDEVVSRFPDIFKYQVVVTRENYQDVMTFLIEPARGAKNIDQTVILMEKDIKDLLTVRGRVKVVKPGSIPDFPDKIIDQRDWK